MDVSGIYWPAVALGVGIMALLVVLFMGRGQERSFTGRFVWLANLLVVFINGAAPIRGALDPNYVGYGFGFLRASKGMDATYIAGSVVLASVIAAALAARNRPGPLMLIVAVVCAFHSVNIGLPLIESILQNPEQVKMQFGEYFTLPHTVAIPILVLLMVFPFLLGTAWALNRSFEAE